MKVLAILFGAGWTVGTALSLGLVLFRRLRIELDRTEECLLGLITGSACLSGIIFVLCATHLARKAVFLVIGAASMAWAWRSRRVGPSKDELPPLPRVWRISFLVIFGVFTVVYFLNALAPELSPDGTAYHLVIVDRYDRAHGFVRVPENIYFNISQGVEMLFLMALAFGKHSAAALVHFGFLVTLPLLMVSFGRRFGCAIAGAAAGLFVYASPVVGVDGLSAYVDVALAAALFAMFYLLQIWDGQRQNRVLIPVSILAGFAFAVKYTAIVAGLYALGFVAWKLWQSAASGTISRKPALKLVAGMAGLMLLFAAPWPIKSWIWVGNPAAPFANRVFPNPWVHVAFEDEFRHNLQHYELASLRQIPMQLTVRGDKLSGLFGPLFLLMPVGLLALRKRMGRHLLLAGAIFALPYATNIGTRFLIPAAPFLTFAFALVLADLPWLLFAVVIADAILGWPTIVSLYCANASWRVPPEIPIRAAFRIESEDSFLRRSWPGYEVDRLIEEHVPVGQSVFLFGATAESYTSRRMLVSYLSAPNQTLRDMLLTPVVAGYQPSVLLNFEFPKQLARKVRAVQTANSDAEMWSITEFHLFVDGHEIPRSRQWRLTAKPDPWEVQLAFDNDPVTRWRTWQPAAEGDYVEVDFGGEQWIDSASIECSTEFTNKQVRLEVLDARDEWRPLSGQAREAEDSTKVNLRAAATAELKAHGINYVLIDEGDFAAQDYRILASRWNLVRIGEVRGVTLYRIE